MQTLNPSGTVTLIAGATDQIAARSQVFVVQSNGIYIFTAATIGPFAALTFDLETVHGYVGQTLLSWDINAINPLSVSLVAGVSYRLTCTSFNGTNVSITAMGTVVVGTPLAFSRGGTLLNPLLPNNVIVWQAPFPCTVKNIRGYTADSTGTTINARKNGASMHLASDLALNSAGAWLDGGAVQNTAYVLNDKLEIMLTGIGGNPSQIAVQVDYTRP